ncbi:conserved membrane protein of unknown function [Candidatus Filomicrobium marinum]|uniref:diguanylate cyclase n=1 Tax=Candidatus Filomicrobium marinum TaxID=1608628 RepID=A0A0D6JIG5_9HYPH|nr:MULTISPECIES: GGDEF domain-containing protein [Filomicrobium]MCV0371481.1 GGDEF domain-containing protein [Filomicrobium sp.]CFX36750.1 conserved membrane protein of unknown function [Candidatus Filomicrobium marinum]CPR21702.1 conserved membrane protein of unknown function [Candidatus Filomicrobium marinum]
MDADPFTLFGANAVILIVTAFAFLAAWESHPQEVYWSSWSSANMTLALAVILFMIALGGQSLLPMILANCLLVLGYGLRWQAARQFSGRPSPLAVIIVPTVLTLGLFALPAIFAYRTTYIAVNIILAIQTIVIAYEFWRDRGDGLPSRYGLMLAYGLIAVSFSARVGQGILTSNGLTSYLPQDAWLQIHLFVALFHTTASGAFALSIAYERSTRELRDAALRDPLTGIHNRRAFEARLQEHLDSGASTNLAVIFFDIDYFKRINDQYGHAAGDAALRTCAEICTKNLRPTDFVARIGGEEFAVILPDISPRAALEATERIRRAVEKTVITHDARLFKVTMSAGLVHSSTVSCVDIDKLMKQADTGLYRAKNNGRNRTESVAA